MNGNLIANTMIYNFSNFNTGWEISRKKIRRRLKEVGKRNLSATKVLTGNLLSNKIYP